MRTPLTTEERAGIRQRAKVLGEAALKAAEETDRARNAAEDAGVEVYVAKNIELSSFEASVVAYDLERLLDETEKEELDEQGR